MNLSKPEQASLKATVVMTPLAVSLSLFASGCAVVGDIFKAGFWVAIVGVVVVAGLVGGGIALFKR